MDTRFTRTAAILAIFSLLLSAFVAGHPVFADDATPAPANLLANASSSLANAKSAHFELKIDGDTFLDDAKTLKLVNAEGDMERPDRVAVQFQVQLFGAGNVSIKMVTIGKQSWTTDLITGKWGPAPSEFGYDPSVLFDKDNGLGPIMGKLTDTTIEGMEKVDGQQAYRVSGTATASDIDAITSGTMSGKTFPVEIWIDVKTNLPLKITLGESSDSGKEHPATWTLTLSNYDHDITIESPV